MSDSAVNSIAVLRLVRNGHCIAVGLTEEDLYSVAPSLREDTIQQIISVEQRVGTVRGEVWNWSKHGGHSFNPKLHWDCPYCNQQWWEDFVGEVSNPYFAGSGCHCADYWLVHWDSTQAKNELE